MRKLLILIPILFLFAISANAQKYPFGTADVLEQSAIDTTVDEGVDTLAIDNRLTFVDVAIDSTHTISFEISRWVEVGAMVYMKVECDPVTAGVDQTLSFDANINATDETLTAAKTSMIQLFYDGSEFNIVAIKQID